MNGPLLDRSSTVLGVDGVRSKFSPSSVWTAREPNLGREKTVRTVTWDGSPSVHLPSGMGAPFGRRTWDAPIGSTPPSALGHALFLTNLPNNQIIIGAQRIHFKSFFKKMRQNDLGEERGRNDLSSRLPLYLFCVVMWCCSFTIPTH